MQQRTDILVATAVRDNAAWCASLCAAHGITSDVIDGVWRAHAPTPEGYPEAVTLEPGLDPESVLAALPKWATSVKDSFADIDLTGGRFRVLLGGRWVARASRAASSEPGALDGAVLAPVHGERELSEWATAHGNAGAFRPPLLDDPTVVILGGRDCGAVVSGAVVSVGSDAVGLSNVFGAASVYQAAAAEAERQFPGRPIVGWESDGDLAAPLAAGFSVIGPLRVWAR
jgi:hypothetical protein